MAMSHWTWPRIRARTAWLSWLSLMAFAQLASVALDAGLNDEAPSYLWLMFSAGATGAWAALPIVLTTVLNAPDRRRAGWGRYLGFHALGWVPFAVVSTALPELLLYAAVVLLDAPLKMSPLSVTAGAALQSNVPLYASLVTLLTTYEEWSHNRVLELESARLQREIAQAELEVVRSRLDPERAYAALVAARDCLPAHPDRCELHIQELGDALRISLSDARPDESTLPVIASPARPHVPATPGAERPPLHEPATPQPPQQTTLRLAWLAIGWLVAMLIAAGSHVAYPQFGKLHYVAATGRAVGAWLALPIISRAVAWAGTPRLRSGRFVARYLMGFVGFALVWALVAPLVREALAWLTGISLPPSSLVGSFLTELQLVGTVHLALAAGFMAASAGRLRRETELRAEMLRRALAESQLGVLDAHLDPHFLFNALNTLGEMAYEDPQRARILIDALRALLRDALAYDGPQWTVAQEELRTQQFADFVVARFDERVRVLWAVPSELAQISIPRLSLQSLVENAVKHNQHRLEPLTIRVEGQREGSHARFRVSDDGDGLRAPVESKARNRSHGPTQRRGGLSRLVEMLWLLHGEEASLEVSAAHAQGMLVELRVPLGRQV
ncbi:MAG: histidine kinase [Myxococcales bacterium]